MALGYGQGDDSRITNFMETIKDYYSSQGFTRPGLTEEEIKELAEFINYYFGIKSRMELKKSKEFLNIAQNFAKAESDKKGKVKIETPYLTWTLRIFEQKASRYRVDINGKETRFQVYHKYGIDKDLIAQTFPSIFIQGLDALIIHMFYYTIDNLNYILEGYGLPKVQIISLHDCYGICLLYAPFLEPIMQELYDEIDALDFPGMPELNSKVKQAIKCINPHFIKH